MEVEVFMLRRFPENITKNVRRLRKDMTEAERIFWYAINRKQLYGYRFRRQHPIGVYIVDFACIDQGCVIELDGGQHQDQIQYDEARTNFLQQEGWQVIRFWNNEILNNLQGVLFILAEKLRVKNVE